MSQVLQQITENNRELVRGLTSEELNRVMRIAHKDANRSYDLATDAARRVIALLGFERLAIELERRKFEPC